MYRFNEYRAAVLRDYKQRKAASQLSHQLTHPTATNLKEEAIDICQKRFQRSDERVLAAFFEQQPNVSEYLQAISKSDADCFKPICNFLRGKTAKPEEKQIELLAWLTNFKDRPYQNYIENNPVKITVAEAEPTDIKFNDQDGHQIIEPKLSSLEEKDTTRSKVIYKNLVLLLSVLFLLVAGLYFLAGKKEMRWDGVQYEIVYLDLFPGDHVVPYDSVKLKHFKMIMRYDTLTEYSLEKVWCVKRNGQFEFFTSDGVHPLNAELKLKPLTDYILNTVVRQKREQILLSSGKRP